MSRDDKKIGSPEWLLENFSQALEDEDALIKDSPLLRELKFIQQRYSDLQALNEGGQKKILACRDGMAQRDLAMAVLHDSKKASSIDAFIREARIGASLEHPNIVPVYDIGINDEDEPFFTMKRLGGENLQALLDQNILPQAQKLDIFLKVQISGHRPR